MNTKVVIYARASAECAAPAEDQIERLNAVADSQGWTVARTFADRPMPLKRGREQRPGEMALLAAIRSGVVKRVLLVSLDRVGKSLTELVAFLEACRQSGTGLYIEDRQIDTDTCNGLSLFDVGAMLAHHLRQGRRDRIMRGQAAARNANIRFGRPPIASVKVDKVRSILLTGKGVREAARLAGGISPASVSRLKASMSAASP